MIIKDENPMTDFDLLDYVQPAQGLYVVVGIKGKDIIKFCLTKINELGLEIYNVDTTIICESPKINPHRDRILASLSEILEIPISKIGLKATTSEKIGIIGRNQAIAVQSSVNLKGIL